MKERSTRRPDTLDNAVHDTINLIYNAQSRSAIINPDCVGWEEVDSNYATTNGRILRLKATYDLARELIPGDSLDFFKKLRKIEDYFEGLEISQASVCLTILLVARTKSIGISIDDESRMRNEANKMMEIFGIDKNGEVTSRHSGGRTHALDMPHLVEKLLTMPESDFAKITT